MEFLRILWPNDWPTLVDLVFLWIFCDYASPFSFSFLFYFPLFIISTEEKESPPQRLIVAPINSFQWGDWMDYFRIISNLVKSQMPNELSLWFKTRQISNKSTYYINTYIIKILGLKEWSLLILTVRAIVHFDEYKP